MDRAAPIPVPVHIRIPRLYSVEVLDTPANWKGVTDRPARGMVVDGAAHLELTCPNFLWRVVDESAGKIALYTILEKYDTKGKTPIYLEHHKSCSGTWRGYPH